MSDMISSNGIPVLLASESGPLNVDGQSVDTAPCPKAKAIKGLVKKVKKTKEKDKQAAIDRQYEAYKLELEKAFTATSGYVYQINNMTTLFRLAKTKKGYEAYELPHHAYAIMESGKMTPVARELAKVILALQEQMDAWRAEDKDSRSAAVKAAALMEIYQTSLALQVEAFSSKLSKLEEMNTRLDRKVHSKLGKEPEGKAWSRASYPPIPRDNRAPNRLSLI